MTPRPPAADAWGIMPGYRDTLGRWHRTAPASRAALRLAMGDPTAAGPIPGGDPVQVVRAGASVPLRGPAELELEAGSVERVERRLPPDLPIGYHRLRPLDSESASWLFVTPGCCYLPKNLRAWGWAIQLYALRSRKSWGLGDLADLRRFARFSARELQAGFVLVNPLGASLPVSPQEASPYSPSSRLFLNPLYLRVEEVPGAMASGVALEPLAAAGRALNAARRIDRDQVFRLKMRALEKIFTRFHGDPAFSQFQATQGAALESFARFCVLAEQFESGWKRWPSALQDPDSAAVDQFAKRHARRVQFYCWLQWLLDRQLAKAARELPVLVDLPIGVSPQGADAWRWQQLLARGVSVGAPPDAFNLAGQNWGLPPFIPHRLRSSGYGAIRETLRASLRHARGLRIDHVMGFFRLYCIPAGAAPPAGAFVRYQAEELLALLAIESHRAQAFVVGEDLGTVEPGIRSKLRRRGLLSYRLLWFERPHPREYPAQALAAVTTHDLATVAGLWTGKDLAAQIRIGLKPNRRGVLAIRRKLIRQLRLSRSASPQEVVLRLHRHLAAAPAHLVSATLDDALLVEERPNMPSTTTEWDNWSLALPHSLERISKQPLVRALARALTRPALPPAAKR